MQFYRQFLYEHRDETPVTEEKRFEVTFLNYVLVVTIRSLEERFLQLESHNSTFQFLNNLFGINKTNDTEIAKLCNSLQIALTDADKKK